MFIRAQYLICLCSLLSIQAHAQIAAGDGRAADMDTTGLVSHLVANAELYRATLPSLTARESIIAKFDEVVVFGKHVYKAEAIVRVMRRSPDGPLEESREITAMDGKPLPHKPGHPRIPVDLADDFRATSALPSDFFSAEHRGCFNFVVASHPEPKKPIEMSIRPASNAATVPSCEKAREGMAGIARVDPVTLQLTHLEASTPLVAGTPGNGITFISADYAPAKLGDKTFWLPTSLTARWTVGKTPYAWTSRYFDYHQYTANSTILPSAAP